jgi:hypothetical protein
VAPAVVAVPEAREALVATPVKPATAVTAALVAMAELIPTQAIMVPEATVALVAQPDWAAPLVTAAVVAPERSPVKAAMVAPLRSRLRVQQSPLESFPEAEMGVKAVTVVPVAMVATEMTAATEAQAG